MLKYSTPSFTSFWQGLPLGLPVPYPSSRVCRGEVLPTVEDNWAGGHTSLWNQVGYIPGCWAAGPHHYEATVLSLKDGSDQGRSLITGNRQISHPYSRRRINRRSTVPAAYSHSLQYLHGHLSGFQLHSLVCWYPLYWVPHTGIKIAFNLLLSLCQCSSGCGWTSWTQGKDTVI